MKKILIQIYRVLCETSLLFAAIVMFFALFIFNTDTAHFTKDTLLSFFWFSLVFGASGLLRVFDKIPAFVLHLFRMIVTAVGFVIFILSTTERSESQMFVGAILFVVLYAVVFIITRLILLPFREKNEE